MQPKTASYRHASASGRLDQLAAEALKHLTNCRLCPRKCGVNRMASPTGWCRIGQHARVAAYHSHFGEESVLVGRGGSGTIFFSGCNLLCDFCQNADISHHRQGQPMNNAALAQIMLDLQASGCANINLVTPSHVVPQILGALVLAAKQGLSLPLVYNTSSYDAPRTLAWLDGIVDIYLPDFKFDNSRFAQETCRAPDYPKVARRAMVEMHRQVGDLVVDRNGIALRGLLVRHLVMPDGVDETKAIAAFIANHLSIHTYVNLMPQYRPLGRVRAGSAWDRVITPEEYVSAMKAARQAGLTRVNPTLDPG